MKVSTAKLVIYGILFIGALIAFIAILIPALSDLLAMFSLIGGLIVVLGIVFCVLVARTPCCPHCHELLSIRNKYPEYCHHCDKELS